MGISRSGWLGALGLLLWAGVAGADYMDHFATRDDVGPRKAPYLGKTSVLLLPVEVKGYGALDLPSIERFFGPEQPEGFRRYYRTASLGRYQPEVTVGPVIRFEACPLPLDRFPGCALPRGDIAGFEPGMDFMREVVRRADAQGVDFSAFDNSGRRGTPDGWVDGVMLLVNLPFGGIAFPLGYFNRGDNLDGGQGGALRVDGVRLGHLAIAGFGDSRVLVHEFGHLLGLTDLYDESSRYPGLQYSFMGAWGYDAAVPLPDAETRFRLRWGRWLQARGTRKMVLGPAETSGEFLRLGNGDEYFLVENRGPGGDFDQGFTARGLAVFHVDRKVGPAGDEGRFVQRLLSCVNCDPAHPYIGVVEADGDYAFRKSPLALTHDAEDLFRDGDVLQTPWYSGAPSGYGLRDISLRADGSVEFTVVAPEDAACDEALCEEGEGCRPEFCGAPPKPLPADGCQAGEGGLSFGLWALLGLGVSRRGCGRPSGHRRPARARPPAPAPR